MRGRGPLRSGLSPAAPNFPATSASAEIRRTVLRKSIAASRPERVIQPLAESYSGRRRMMYSRRHKFRAAKFEESPVTHAMACCPIEDANRIGIGYPIP